MYFRRVLAGAVAALVLAALAASELIAALPKDRKIAFTNIHTKETVSVQYVKGGRYVPDAMEKLNWILRDWRKDEATKMAPELIDLIWEVHTELGSNEPIHIISGFRSRATNDLLRKTVGGQASESRHMVGKAADVYFPDVPLKKLRYSALIRERGGVGYYPTSATPFVHLDTDRVRHWPRLPRFELALLFPSGQTQHQPMDGGPITSDDVKIAQSRYRELAVQVAEFMGARRDPSTAVTLVADAGGRQPVLPPRAPPARQQVAALTPPAPRLVVEPAVVDRSSRLAPRPTNDDRSKLTQLFALASLDSSPRLIREPQPVVRPQRNVALPSLTGPSPAIPVPAVQVPAKPEPRVAAVDPRSDSRGSISDLIGWSTGWAQAPAFDEEHPEELSYHPFPLAPYLTDTASVDDPALAVMTHPDVSKTLDLLDQAGTMPPMRLRPGQQVAQLLWAQQFQGAAVPTEKLLALAKDGIDDRASGIADRRVTTSLGRR